LSVSERALIEALAGDRPVSIEQAGLDVRGFEKGILGQDRFSGISSGQHGQDMFHCNPHPSDDGLTAEYSRAHYDSVE